LGLGNEIFILVPTVGSPGLSFSLKISFARAALKSRREITNHLFAIARLCNIALKSLPRSINAKSLLLKLIFVSIMD
jgi:hypothetical protein